MTAGLGVPAVFVGIFAVLPATSDRIRAAVAIGSSISVFGVAMFWYAYPSHWAGYGQNLTLPVVAVYFVGLITTFCCLFVAVVNFKTRNDPGGTVTMGVTRKGETKIVEVERQRGLGSIGVFGDHPADSVDAVSDGGATTNDISSPADPEHGQTTPTDTYCGNCSHFDYVPTDDGMTPYCGFHNQRMTDMDAYDQWQSNRCFRIFTARRASVRLTPSDSLSRSAFHSSHTAKSVFRRVRGRATRRHPGSIDRCTTNSARAETAIARILVRGALAAGRSRRAIPAKSRHPLVSRVVRRA